MLDEDVAVDEGSSEESEVGELDVDIVSSNVVVKSLTGVSGS